MSEPTKSNFFKDPQNIIAVGVTIISLCALIVSVVQTRVLQEEREVLQQNAKATVWPRIEIWKTQGFSKTDGQINMFSISVTNSGVGPAIITDVKVTYNDSIAHYWDHLFHLQEIPDSVKYYHYSSTINNKIIKAGDSFDALNLNTNLPLADAFYKKLEGVTIVIYYESIYGDKWKYKCDFKDRTTTEVNDFEGLPEDEQFKN